MMAKDQLRVLHLFAMESALPFGMGIINNARTGGLEKIINVCKSNDPFSEFQVDGENSAKIVRDKIDQLIPGLGHPVVSVDVTVEENYPDYESKDSDSLVSTLNRIDNQLDQLRYYFKNDSKTIDNQ
tara:strand:- start:116 stop:496 length:381 start_codon:yes stop_codon:yes gene_type:complete